MTRLLLVLPTATYRATGFLAAAARLDVEVVTASERRQALASVMGDRFLELPLDDPEEAAERIVDLARRLPLDAVVAVDDQGLLAAALAAERLGLGHAAGAVAATRDKAVMRGLLAAGGVPQPAFTVVAPAESPGQRAEEALVEAVVAAAANLGFPAVLKPCCLSGSRGVIRVDDPDEARCQARRVRAIARQAGGAFEEPLLVESYVPGDEVALEGLLTRGHLEVLALFDKPDPLVGPYFEETLYVTPSRHPAPVQEAVVAAVQQAATALGLSEGPVHGEVRIRPGTEGDARAVAVLELAARTIGGRCAQALAFATGTTLEEVVLRHALGLPATAAVLSGASGVMMLPIPASGRLETVGGTEEALAVPGVTGLEITIPPGRAVQALPEGDRYLGFLFARGADPDAVEASLRKGHEQLHIRIGEARVAG